MEYVILETTTFGFYDHFITYTFFFTFLNNINLLLVSILQNGNYIGFKIFSFLGFTLVLKMTQTALFVFSGFSGCSRQCLASLHYLHRPRLLFPTAT